MMKKIVNSKTEVEIIKTGMPKSIASTKNPFLIDTKFYYAEFPYEGLFKVVEAHVEPGSEFRRVQGGSRADDVVIELRKLQKSMENGKITIMADEPIVQAVLPDTKKKTRQKKK